MRTGLKREIAKRRRLRELKALGLVVPLFLFLFATFFVPIVLMLWQSVADPLVRPVLPRTVESLGSWDGVALPPEAAYAALIEDLRAVQQPELLAKAAGRLNADRAGLRSLLFKTSDAVVGDSAGPAHDRLVAIDRQWDDIETWAAIARASGPLTDLNLLAALDLERNPRGEVVAVPHNRAVFLQVLLRTLTMAVSVAVLCLLIGFPLALLLASLSQRWSNLVMYCVLLPLWTSILVRTLSWSVLLQREGILNDFLVAVGIVDAPLKLMYNRAAVYISMVHILLPFMVLALFSVMKGIEANYVRAAASLGAPPFTVFRRIYLPQVLPGITSGCLLVFIQALGVYITPALLGSPDDQGIATLIAFYVNKTANWGLAAALSVLLLAATSILYVVYSRLARDRQPRMA